MSLDRFKTAQTSRYTGYDVALSEITAGQKVSHWIWYIFPQLAGLGGSAMSANYAIRDRNEAMGYLTDPLLGPRLMRITAVAAEQVQRRIPLPELMGSEVDALKLVSSLTLFEATANALPATETSPELKTFLANCGTILESASKQGYPRCRFTLAHLADA